MRVDLDVLEGVEESTEDFASLLAEYEGQEKVNSEDGRFQDAVIVKITDKSVSVDVHEKTEGKFPIEEITDKSGNLLFKEGDTISVYITRRGGESFSVSYEKGLVFKKTQERIKELGEDYKSVVIDGVISKKNKGGSILLSDGVEYFIPRAYGSSKDEIGRRVKACIVNVKPEANSIIASRKRYFDLTRELHESLVGKFLESSEPLEGVVRNITKFGIFVSVQGVEGLVHYTEITHKGPVNPANFYSEGDRVQVKAIKYDAEKRRLSFSIKALQEDPWKEVINTLQVGYTIKATVSNIEAYGAFVDVGGDLEGFLHISEISWDKGFRHPSEKLKLGEEIEVEIIEINAEHRRLRVSLKKLQEKPFEKFARDHKEGDIIKAKVQTITDFGAFLNLGEVDGLLHNEDASWDKSKKCKDFLKVGEELTVKIIKLDEKANRISLSLRALLDSPVQEFAKKHKVDDIVTGKIVDIKNFGMFVEIDGISTLLRSEDTIDAVSLKKGSEVEVALVSIDASQNKVRVSMRRVSAVQEQREIMNFNSNSDMTLGDKLKAQLKL